MMGVRLGASAARAASGLGFGAASPMLRGGGRGLATQGRFARMGEWHAASRRSASRGAAGAAALGMVAAVSVALWASGAEGEARCEVEPIPVVDGQTGKAATEALGVPKVEEDEPTEGLDGAHFYIPPAGTSKMKIFSGNGNWHLANEISMHLGTQLGRATVKRFADGEVSVNIHDNVRGKNVFVVQPLGPPVNENLMELLLMVTTLRRSSARHITAVIPYYGYCRSTKKSKSEDRSPIAAADVAKMLQIAGVDRVVAVDLHHNQIQGFFGPGTPVDNLDVSSLAIPYFETKFLRNPVVVSPDANGAARAKVFRDKLVRHKVDAGLALIVEQEPLPRDWENKAKAAKGPSSSKDILEWTKEDLESMDLVGDVANRDCIIFDDLVDSGGRITRAAKKLKLAGARRVFAFATHGLFLGNAYERIEKSDLIEVVCVNTVPLATSSMAGVNSWVYSNKVHQLSIAALLAEAIKRINEKKSVTGLV